MIYRQDPVFQSFHFLHCVCLVLSSAFGSQKSPWSWASCLDASKEEEGDTSKESNHAVSITNVVGVVGLLASDGDDRGAARDNHAGTRARASAGTSTRAARASAGTSARAARTSAGTSARSRSRAGAGARGRVKDDELAIDKDLSTLADGHADNAFDLLVVLGNAVFVLVGNVAEDHCGADHAGPGGDRDKVGARSAHRLGRSHSGGHGGSHSGSHGGGHNRSHSGRHGGRHVYCAVHGGVRVGGAGAFQDPALGPIDGRAMGLGVAVMVVASVVVMVVVVLGASVVARGAVAGRTMRASAVRAGVMRAGMV